MQEEPPALRSQRAGMVKRIAQEARNRTEAQGEIAAAGRQEFRAADMEATLDTRGTVDVGTRWMEPVVQVSAPFERLRMLPDSGRKSSSLKSIPNTRLSSIVRFTSITYSERAPWLGRWALLNVPVPAFNL